MSNRNQPQPAAYASRLIRRHLLVGWGGLLLFLTLGIVLETLHGLKSSFYLDPGNSTRRLVWTLAHAHGTLFAMVNMAFALSLSRINLGSERLLRFASPGFIGALVLLPLGFFLGGLRVFGGDPGVGIVLVPLGAVWMLLSVAAFCWSLRGGGQP